MGEVYRADDLTLGQQVALKFLPQNLSANPTRLELFRSEVRLARQISHPTVCRVYDIGENQGQPFLSMEYVDGEDLSVLLRRIGRLPTDKGLQIARQLCYGLAAAHEKGVLHRDLKPANIMIDGAGSVRITDFGLAQLAEQAVEAQRAGTPCYMAPEQLAGQPASVRSDIYALGLVLYEIFTGKRAVPSTSVGECIRFHAQQGPLPLSSLLPDVDPAIEHVIRDCLTKEPKARPASALAVAAALPGGDPLAAALAAGETPAPEVVAAASEQGMLRPAVATALLLVVIVGLAGNLLLSKQLRAVEHFGLPKAPEVLADRAANILQHLGYDDPTPHSAYGFQYEKVAGDAVASPSGPMVTFWYRQSPQPLFARRSDMDESPPHWRVSFTDPPATEPGMLGVRLDCEGRLLELVAVSERSLANTAPGNDGPAVPIALLAEVGLDPEELTPTDPVMAPPVYCDRLQAWKGANDAGDPAGELRVEVGTQAGRVVWFRRLSEQEIARLDCPSMTWQRRVAINLYTSIYLITLAGGMVLALRHWRLGRSDRKGALRLASFVFLVLMTGWALSANHVADLGAEFFLLGRFALAKSLLLSAEIWVLYQALEPYVRRRCPERIISWTRLLAGRWRDPLVGRDLLIGCVAGVVPLTVIGALLVLFRAILGLQTPFFPVPPGSLESYLGACLAGGELCNALVAGINMGMLFVILPLLLWVCLRRQQWANVATLVIWAGFFHLCWDGGANWSFLAYATLLTAVMLWVTIRFGLLASTGMFFCIILLMDLPSTADWSAWYAGTAFFGNLLIGVLALCSFLLALAGRPLLRDDLLEAV